MSKKRKVKTGRNPSPPARRTRSIVESHRSDSTKQVSAQSLKRFNDAFNQVEDSLYKTLDLLAFLMLPERPEDMLPLIDHDLDQLLEAYRRRLKQGGALLFHARPIEEWEAIHTTISNVKAGISAVLDGGDKTALRQALLSHMHPLTRQRFEELRRLGEQRKREEAQRATALLQQVADQIADNTRQAVERDMQAEIEQARQEVETARARAEQAQAQAVQLEQDYQQKIVEAEALARAKAKQEHREISVTPDTLANWVIEQRIVQAVEDLLKQDNPLIKNQTDAIYARYWELHERYIHPEIKKLLSDEERDDYWYIRTEVDKAEKISDRAKRRQHMSKWISKITSRQDGKISHPPS